jgi:hypothetical protein
LRETEGVHGVHISNRVGEVVPRLWKSQGFFPDPSPKRNIMPKYHIHTCCG